jgi:hypothetical protein
MRQLLPVLLFAALLVVAPAGAADVGLDLNLHLGGRASAPVIVEEPPLFLVPAALGVHVAVGVPYDLFYLGGRYYCAKGGAWYVAPAYGGPWAVVVHDRLPPGLRRHQLREMVVLRDVEYRRYRQDRDHYRGRSFRPERARHEGGSWKEARHERKKKHGKHDD